MPDEPQQTPPGVDDFGDMYYTVDADWRITYLNEQTAARWGFSRDDLVGRTLWDILPDDEETEGYRMHHRAARERRTLRFETFSSVPGRWLDMVIYPQEDGGLAVHARDVTERREALEELEETRKRLERRVAERTEDLRQAKEDAEHASKVKGQFLNTISHELRTPLNAVIGLADLMSGEMVGPMNDRQRDLLARIRSSAWHLVDIIDEILTFSRTEAGKEEVTAREVDVAEITRQVVGVLQTQARVEDIELYLRGADEPLVVVTDAPKVRQILVNLLGNALEYTEQGWVEVCLEADAEWINMEVRDTGPGIPSEKLDAIFEPFYQVDQSSTRSHGGTGLGLAVTRRLARLLDGEVSVESDPGEGSTFRVRLPRNGAVPEAAGAGTGG